MGFDVPLDHLVTIDILGQPFTFKSDENGTDARAVADYVTNAVNQIQSQSPDYLPNIEKGAILLLAALNITSDFLTLRKKHQQLLQEIDNRSAHLLKAIEGTANSNAPVSFQ
jgi:cell division protein ZapA (FtsZ GTPase activity inhibitor)